MRGTRPILAAGALAVALLSSLAACGTPVEVAATPPSPAPQADPGAAPAPVPPPPPIPEEDTFFCPADVKLCPDGSGVARNPAQRCDFDPCPGAR